ncbi:MAG TPA: response regulator [bacterium]|nr:response regulator [bacterium]
MGEDAEEGCLNILLVEDNPGDVRLIVETMAEGFLPHSINIVRDGEEALNYLQGKCGFESRETPGLVLLDLKIPKKDGFEVLEEMRKDSRLASVPVVILTSSEAEEDVKKAFMLEANYYVSKPADLDRYIIMIESIKNFWLTIIKGEK